MVEDVRRGLNGTANGSTVLSGVAQVNARRDECALASPGTMRQTRSTIIRASLSNLRGASMDHLHCMRVFTAVVEAGGFAGAARRLNLSPATVTRAVADLENHLGVTLLTRTTRVVRTTDAGERYAQDCRRILSDLHEADSAAAGVHAQPKGLITVTASVLFGNRYIAPLVVEYLTRFPEAQANCLFTDRIVNMDDEGFDVAVRLGELPDSSLQAVRVGTTRRVVCASPEYLARRGVPQHPVELAMHTVISARGLTPSPQWRFQEDGESTVVEVRPALMTTTNDSAIAAATSGFGLVRLMSYQISEHLRAGTLKTVLTEFEPATVPIHVMHRQGRRPSAKVRAFLDLTIERLRGDPSLN